MSFIISQCIGYIAGAFTTACIVPQLYRAITTRSTLDISYGFILCLCAGLVMWLVYGVLIGEIPVIVPNAISLVLNLSLLGIKVVCDIPHITKIFTGNKDSNSSDLPKENREC